MAAAAAGAGRWQSVYEAEAASTVRLLDCAGGGSSGSDAERRAIDALVERLQVSCGVDGPSGSWQQLQERRQYQRTQPKASASAGPDPATPAGAFERHQDVPDSGTRISQTPGMTPPPPTRTPPPEPQEEPTQEYVDPDASHRSDRSCELSPGQEEEQRYRRQQLLAAEGGGGSVLRHGGNRAAADRDDAGIALVCGEQSNEDIESEEEVPSYTQRGRQDRRRQLLAAEGGGGSVLRCRGALQRAATDPGPAPGSASTGEDDSSSQERNRRRREFLRGATYDGTEGTGCVGGGGTVLRRGRSTPHDELEPWESPSGMTDESEDEPEGEPEDGDSDGGELGRQLFESSQADVGFGSQISGVWSFR